MTRDDRAVAAVVPDACVPFLNQTGHHLRSREARDPRRVLIAVAGPGHP